MASDSHDSNAFVFEYHNADDSIETVFQQVTSTLTESASEITGFRIELTTTEAVDIPFDTLVNQQSALNDASAETTQEPTQSAATSSSAEETSATTTEVPSLQSDALPAQVLSILVDQDADSVRTSDLTKEFDDADIDTARISQTLASLKRRDLVAAEPDPDDKRANLYWPTEQGQQALSQ